MALSSPAISPATTFSAIHPDIIQTHILSRLDGPTLASAACTSSQLHAFSSEEHLWANICHSTWPSTTMPRVLQVISTFPRGPLSFFSDAFPLISAGSDPAGYDSGDRSPISELISAVDVRHKGKLIFSKVVESETESAWFKCSPFRVDLLDPKDRVTAGIKYPTGEGECKELGEELRLSWILIDPVGKRAVNVSSQKAVSVHRHWLSGEIQARFATIAVGKKGWSSELVQCGVLVMFGGGEGEEMQIREVSLQVEDMDGKHLNGRDSLGILQGALEGKEGKKIWREGEEEGKKRYEGYLEKKRERQERKVKKEGTLDMLFVGFAVFSFAGILFFVFS